jgi:uncharacterized protein
MFAVHNYQQGVQVLLAACDPELLDTEHKEGKLRLEVPSRFYDGMRVDEAGLRAVLSSCTVANLVGPKTIEVAVEMGLVDPDHVLEVNGVPHAQMMLL